MEVVRKINDELAIAGIIPFEQWQQIAEAGFQSVLDLRSLEPSRFNTERQLIESLGLQYASLLIDREMEGMSIDVAWRVLQQLDELPKPALVCNNITLAAAMVLMHIAMRQGESLQQAFQRAEKLGLFRISTQPVTSPLIG